MVSDHQFVELRLDPISKSLAGRDIFAEKLTFKEIRAKRF